MLSLTPDLVAIYGSQADLRRQLARASIPVFDYRHGGLADVFATMRALGVRTGHGARADEVAQNLERRIDEVRRRTSAQPRPRVLLVFGREPGSLRNIYASGGRGFLHDMLDAAGGVNVFADVAAGVGAGDHRAGPDARARRDPRGARTTRLDRGGHGECARRLGPAGGGARRQESAACSSSPATAWSCPDRVSPTPWNGWRRRCIRAGDEDPGLVVER